MQVATFLLSILVASVPSCDEATSSMSSPARASRGAWRGLEWGVSRAKAVLALRNAGLDVEDRRPTKSPSTWISTRIEGGWSATVYFDENDRMNQVTLIAERITPEGVKAARDRLAARFGRPERETQSSDQRWQKGADGPWSRLLLARGPSGWSAYEEHGRGSAAGPAGALDLSWGAASTDVETRLRAAGYHANTGAPDIDPCKMPNPPPNCEPDASVVVRFSKTGEDGSANVHKTRGLTQISWSIASVASREEGLARAARIEALRGPAVENEETTATTWSDGTTSVTLDVKERKRAGTWSAIETYRPAG